MQLEEDISEHLRWSISLKSILNAGQSDFQAYELVDTYQFGKVGTAAIVQAASVQYRVVRKQTIILQYVR